MKFVDDMPTPTLDAATRQLLLDPQKRRSWLLYQFNLRGVSLAAVARSVGLHRSAIYNAFTKPYPRMEKLLADLLGLKPWDIFPDRYDSDGLPNRRRGRPISKSCAHGDSHNAKATPASKKRNPQKRMAA
jgi:Predicted transcriptional regulator